MVMVFSLCAGCLTPQTAYSQSLLRKIGSAAKRAAESTVERKVEEKVEEEVSEAFEKAFDKKEKSAIEEIAATTTEEVAVTAEGTTQQTDRAKKAEIDWGKSDFVPGDQIIIEDNLTHDRIGEFPANWDLLEGSADVVRFDGEKAILLLDNCLLSPLMENSQRYLPEAFTLEFDFYIPRVEEDENPDYFGYRILMYTDMDGAWESVSYLTMQLYLYPYTTRIICDYEPPDYNGKRAAYKDPYDFLYGDWSHFALSFNKRALKVYINGDRCINIPNMAAPLRFCFGQEYAPADFAYIKNIRFAQGAVPLNERILHDGKFISYGITFDTGKSTIKPESAGEINRIFRLMQDNPSYRFSVEGHTDSTGSAQLNQTLSQDRANAVVERLVSMGIQADRLQAKGMGQNSPIADNATAEGRAKNRRVEFVLM
jgi:outer membrane protein OmpA-like peptidoglycan-associated protein